MEEIADGRMWHRHDRDCPHGCGGICTQWHEGGPGCLGKSEGTLLWPPSDTPLGIAKEPNRDLRERLILAALSGAADRVAAVLTDGAYGPSGLGARLLAEKAVMLADMVLKVMEEAR